MRWRMATKNTDSESWTLYEHNGAISMIVYEHPVNMLPQGRCQISAIWPPNDKQIIDSGSSQRCDSDGI
jgi:hypothetical protein